MREARSYLSAKTGTAAARAATTYGPVSAVALCLNYIWGVHTRGLVPLD